MPPNHLYAFAAIFYSATFFLIIISHILFYLTSFRCDFQAFQHNCLIVSYFSLLQFFITRIVQPWRVLVLIRERCRFAPPRQAHATKRNSTEIRKSGVMTEAESPADPLGRSSAFTVTHFPFSARILPFKVQSLFVVRILVCTDLQCRLIACIQRRYNCLPKLRFNILARILCYFSAATGNVLIFVKSSGLFLS